MSSMQVSKRVIFTFRPFPCVTHMDAFTVSDMFMFVMKASSSWNKSSSTMQYQAK
jgi:hypothetical protein